MGHIREKKTVIRKKNPTKPQRKIEFRRVTINNQVQRLNKDAMAKRNR